MRGNESKVLVVNDEPGQLELTRMLLEKAGYRVLAAGDAGEALRVARGERPHLVISDVVMPGRGGIDLCHAIRSDPELRATPILLLSAVRTDSGSAAEGIEAGADDYLEVPFDPTLLVAKVARMVERARANEVLLESEERFRLLVEGVREYAIFMTDTDGRITSWNAGVGRVLGYGEAEFVGQHISVIFTPEDVAAGEPEREMKMARERGQADDERWHVRKGGARFWATGVVTPLRDESGELRGFAKVMRDNTERKAAEERLRESEGQFRTLAESIPQLAWMADSEGFIFWYNRRWYDYTGTTLEEMRGWGWQKVHHPEEVGRVTERFKRAVASGEPWEDTFPLRGRTGEYRRFLSRALPICDATGRAVRWFGTNTDVEEQLRAEERLRASEHRFRGVFNQQFQFMAILSPEGVLQEVNDLPLRAAGITREQVVGRPFWETPWWDGLPEMRAGWPARLAEAARADGPVFSEGLYQAAGGETRVADASVTAVKDAGGRVEFFIVEANDITERKRAEEERERLLERERAARAEAERANRLKDEFLATLSHELRTPLTAVLGWARMLRAGDLGRESVARALEAVERNAQAQKQLIDDILDVSRVVTGQLRLDVRPVHLVPVIESAVDSVRPAAEAKNIRIRVQVAPRAGLVPGDSDRLRQVIWNLLSNAVKFTPEGGRVEVRLERAGSSVRVRVSDTGRGIEPEFLPHVFDRFRQADATTTRTHGGLGLGLAIVRHLVELHGGTVTAESEGTGRGATLTVTLPTAPARTEDTKPAAPAVEAESLAERRCPPVLEGLRVLVIDDDPDTLEFLTAALERCGARVTAAASAAEGYRVVEQTRPDVLVSDIGMPDEDGYALIRRVRKLPKHRGGRTPALAVTAYAREEDRVEAYRAGYQMHLSKPVEPGDLAAVVAGLAGRTGDATDE